MIVVTGDVHGDIKRFKKKELHKLKKNDCLIICGDFGFIWNGGKKEKRILKKIGKKKYNVLFVDGVHENFKELKKYDEEYWCGGNTRHISGNLRQLMRGQIYEISGKRIFSFGGGRTEDNDSYLECRVPLLDEEPGEEEIAEAKKNLDEAGNKVDIIVTHEAPSRVAEFLQNGKTDRSHVNTFLQEICEHTDFGSWFFGRYHVNKKVPPKYYAVFDDIVVAESKKSQKIKKGEN